MPRHTSYKKHIDQRKIGWDIPIPLQDLGQSVRVLATFELTLFIQRALWLWDQEECAKRPDSYSTDTPWMGSNQNYLVKYLRKMVVELMRRRGNSNDATYLTRVKVLPFDENGPVASWYNNEKVYLASQAYLMLKNPEYYKQYQWDLSAMSKYTTEYEIVKLMRGEDLVTGFHSF